MTSSTHTRDMAAEHAVMLEALYCILNIEGAAMLGGQCGAMKGLDVPYHFDVVRAAIAKAVGGEG